MLMVILLIILIIASNDNNNNNNNNSSYQLNHNIINQLNEIVLIQIIAYQLS